MVTVFLCKPRKPRRSPLEIRKGDWISSVVLIFFLLFLHLLLHFFSLPVLSSPVLASFPILAAFRFCSTLYQHIFTALHKGLFQVSLPKHHYLNTMFFTAENLNVVLWLEIISSKMKTISLTWLQILFREFLWMHVTHLFGSPHCDDSGCQKVPADLGTGIMLNHSKEERGGNGSMGMAGDWKWMDFEVPSNSSLSVIIW